MPDITMCKGTECPVKEKCFRFTAKSDEHQSYFVDVPGKLEGNKFTCSYFWGKATQETFEQLVKIVNGEENE